MIERSELWRRQVDLCASEVAETEAGPRGNAAESLSVGTKLKAYILINFSTVKTYYWVKNEKAMEDLSDVQYLG